MRKFNSGVDAPHLEAQADGNETPVECDASESGSETETEAEVCVAAINYVPEWMTICSENFEWIDVRDCELSACAFLNHF